MSLLCLLICVFGLYALMRKKPRSSEEGGVEYNTAVQNRHFMVRRVQFDKYCILNKVFDPINLILFLNIVIHRVVLYLDKRLLIDSS